MIEYKPNPDWPENRFDDYLGEARAQLGKLWSLSEDATVANCGNLQLLWSPEHWTWILSDDGIEIGRFQLPLRPNSISRFHRLCSEFYRSG